MNLKAINFNVPQHEAGLPDWLRVNNPLAYYMEQGQAIINGEFEAITINEILLGMKDFVALHQPEGRVITISNDGDIITMEAIDTYALDGAVIYSPALVQMGAGVVSQLNNI